ncbi:MAG: DsbA family protein [Deltaproteobacteria bacterium]|nr:DsbA family protein [Deltaproteobacteria bacterium]
METHDVGVRWTAFPLHPNTPVDGLTLEELFEGRGINIPEIMDRLKRVAQEEGLPFGRRERTYNSRLAQELGKWAESKERGNPFHKAAFHAYFADGINIARIQNLVDLAVDIGLSGQEAQEVLEKRVFKDAVDSDWARSREMGITAVPTFIINGKAVVGAQPYAVLERFLMENQVRKRPF